MKSDALRLLIALLALASCNVAIAGETDAGLAIPSPIGTLPSSTVITQASVSVHGTAATLQYEFRNTAPEAIDGRFTLYLPLFNWTGTDTAYPDKSLADLQVQHDAKNSRVQTHLEAFHQGRRVTDVLTRYGLDPLQITLGDKAPIPYRANHSGQYQKAIQSGLLTLDDGLLYPNWHLLVSRSWTLHVGAQSSTAMTMKYTLQPAYEPFNTKDRALDGLLRTHCSSIEDMAATFKAMNAPWPEQGIVQRFEISADLGVSTMPTSVDLDFVQDRPWAGLVPRFSVICQGNDTPVIGTPSIKQSITRTSNKPFSILVFFPQ